MNGAGGYLDRLSGRQRALAVLLCLVLFASFGYQTFWKPSFSQGMKFKGDLQKAREQIQVVKSKFPDVDAEKKEFAKLREEYEGVLRQISDYEAKMPAVNSVSQLLGEIVRRSDGLNMDFESIRQDVAEEKEGYSRLKLDMKFLSPYSSIVNYLRRLENLSDYLTVQEIRISQFKDAALQAETTLRLSMLLVEKGMGLAVKGEEETLLPLKVQKDPFVSKEAQKGKRAEFKLSGITSAGKDSTAIINDEVAKIGTQLGEWKVADILPGAVILSDGVETLSLTLGR